MDILTELKNKKTILRQKKEQKIKLEGQLDQQLKQLKDEFSVSTVEEADELLENYQKDKTEVLGKLEECKKELDAIDI